MPGPDLRKKDESRSLTESSGAYGWTFIDVTPADARSPLATLKMPRGSIALSNSGYGAPFVLPAARLNTAPPDRTPTLASTSLVERVTQLREEARTLRANDHKNYLERVNAFTEEGMGIDVIERLQQDLVLELERELDRSFVAVGDAPPKLEPPVIAKRALDEEVLSA